MIIFFSKGPVDWERCFLSGAKLHTVRPGEATRVRPGSRLQLYVDRFGPGRRMFAETACVSKQSVEVIGGAVVIDGAALGKTGTSDFAKNGGFESVEQMLGYYGDGFKGQVIHWTHLKY